MIEPELIFLHRESKGSTRWLEPVLERVDRMSRRFDGNADGLVTGVWKLYAEKSPALGLWAGIHEDRVVGHLLAQVQQYDGRWVVFITQAEDDVPVTVRYRDVVLGAITDWAEQFNASFKSQGIHVEDVVFQSPRMQDAWARHSGFTPYRMVFTRPLWRKP